MKNNPWLTLIQQRVRKYLEKKTGRWLFSEKELQNAERKLKTKEE